MIRSWIESARLAVASGALLLGAGGEALAGDRPSIDVQVSTPGFYTRFATGPGYGHYPPYYGPGGYYVYAPPPVPVYVPGYWTYAQPRGYWNDDHRHYDRGRKHHKRDRGRHNGWRNDHRDH